MNEDRIRDQARAIAAALPALMRQLSALPARDPARDLPVGQLRVCAVLQDGLRSMTSLSRELSISVSAITQIADRLERARIVERIPDSSDRRVRSLRLTGRGLAMMRRRREGRVERIEEALRTLAPGARGRVATAMRTLLSAATATAADAGDTRSSERRLLRRHREHRPPGEGDRHTRKDNR
jgi:DNA-binding MarR family transcriptional regulator